MSSRHESEGILFLLPWGMWDYKTNLQQWDVQIWVKTFDSLLVGGLGGELVS